MLKIIKSPPNQLEGDLMCIYNRTYILYLQEDNLVTDLERKLDL